MLRLPNDSIRFLLVTAGLIFLGGYVAGAVIMGIYLYISQAVFRRHSQEAFSSLRIPDFKHLLRFHLDSTGALNLYAIGLDRTPRRWKPATDPGPQFEPADHRPSAPRLIEPVLRIE